MGRWGRGGGGVVEGVNGCGSVFMLEGVEKCRWWKKQKKQKKGSNTK